MEDSELIVGRKYIFYVQGYRYEGNFIKKEKDHYLIFETIKNKNARIPISIAVIEEAK